MLKYQGRKTYYENEERKIYHIAEIKLGGESILMINSENNTLEKELPYDKINSITENYETNCLNINVYITVNNIF
jgi:hypothetical protein